MTFYHYLLVLLSPESYLCLMVLLSNTFYWYYMSYTASHSGNLMLIMLVKMIMVIMSHALPYKKDYVILVSSTFEWYHIVLSWRLENLELLAHSLACKVWSSVSPCSCFETRNWFAIDNAKHHCSFFHFLSPSFFCTII